jgi:hypothetical protein
MGIGCRLLGAEAWFNAMPHRSKEEAKEEAQYNKQCL